MNVDDDGHLGSLFRVVHFVETSSGMRYTGQGKFGVPCAHCKSPSSSYGFPPAQIIDLLQTLHLSGLVGYFPVFWG